LTHKVFHFIISLWLFEKIRPHQVPSGEGVEKAAHPGTPAAGKPDQNLPVSPGLQFSGWALSFYLLAYFILTGKQSITA